MTINQNIELWIQCPAAWFCEMLMIWSFCGLMELWTNDDFIGVSIILCAETLYLTTSCSSGSFTTWTLPFSPNLSRPSSKNTWTYSWICFESLSSCLIRCICCCISWKLESCSWISTFCLYSSALSSRIWYFVLLRLADAFIILFKFPFCNWNGNKE